MDLFAQIQAWAKLTFWSKRDPLDIPRSNATNGTARFRGTTYSSHFMYGVGVEDTYIRGGLSTSDIYIGDVGDDVIIGNSAAVITLTGNFGTWTNFTYNTGWADFGGGYQGGQFRKIGDLIYLRGLVKHTSGALTTIATLPAGHIPPATVFYDSTDADITARVEVTTGGAIVLSVGSGATYVSLNLPPFSII